MGRVNRKVRSAQHGVVTAFVVSAKFLYPSGPVGTGMGGDRLRTGEPPRDATSHPCQLSLLPYAGTGNEYAVMHSAGE